MRAEPPPPQSTDPHLHTSIQLLPQDPCRALWEHLRRSLVSLFPPYWTFITLAWPAKLPGFQVNRLTHLTVSSACCCMVEDCRSLWGKTNRLKHSFLHQAVRMLNFFPALPPPTCPCSFAIFILFMSLITIFYYFAAQISLCVIFEQQIRQQSWFWWLSVFNRSQESVCWLMLVRDDLGSWKPSFRTLYTASFNLWL